MMAVLALVLLLRRKDLVQLTSRFLFTVRSVLLCMYAIGASAFVIRYW